MNTAAIDTESINAEGEQSGGNIDITAQNTLVMFEEYQHQVTVKKLATLLSLEMKLIF